MSYYDNVKDTVRKESNSENSSENSSSSETSNSSSGMADKFSTLREAAQQNDTEEEGDDTPIEVLEEGLQNRSQAQSSAQPQKTREPQKTSQSVQEKSTPVPASSSSSDSEIAEKLDKIIEQNARMIEILESFGR